jgi:hypothetical protein
MINLKDLTADLKTLGTIASQSDLSALAGRKRSWLSATLAHGRRPSTTALVVLLHNLSEIEQETRAEAERAHDPEERSAYAGGAAALHDWVRRVEAEIRRRIQNAET